MKKLSVFLTISGLLFLIISCETDNLPTNATKSSSSEQFENDIEKIEISESDLALINSYTLEKSSDNEQRNAVVDEVLLKYFAMAVAKSLKHPEICQTLKKKISEKFDGDYDVLWEQIKNTQISGQEMREMVNSRFSDRTKQILTMEMIEKVPLLQVSLPVNFDNWDGESTILVAYTPLTIDDMEWEEINAYDSNLKEYMLDAKTEPDYPVMVVGINERSNEGEEATTNTLAKSVSVASSSHESGDNEWLYKFRFTGGDRDPWPLGDGEVYVVSSGTLKGKTSRGPTWNLVNLGDGDDDLEDNHTYTLNRLLFCWHTDDWGDAVGFGVLERDGDDHDWKIKSISENYSVEIVNTSNDDFIGSYIRHRFDEPSGKDLPDFGSVTVFSLYYPNHP